MAGRAPAICLYGGEGMLMTAVGSVSGLAFGIGASRFLAGLLFGVRAADPITLALIAMLFVVVSVFAMLVPARRALRVEPGFALSRSNSFKLSALG
jgi:putative ABC transport system permease protein